MPSLRIDWLWVPHELTNASRVNGGVCCVTIAEQPTLDVLRITRVHCDSPEKQINCVKKCTSYNAIQPMLRYSVMGCIENQNIRFRQTCYFFVEHTVYENNAVKNKWIYNLLIIELVKLFVWNKISWCGFSMRPERRHSSSDPRG